MNDEPRSCSVHFSPAAQRLLTQSASAAFWDRSTKQLLPISRRDTKEIGDVREGLTTTLIGLEVRTDARDPLTADRMVHILGEFFANALLRERIRAWIVAGLGETRTRQKTLRADIIATQMTIESAQRRIADLKAIVARYPRSRPFGRSPGNQYYGWRRPILAALGATGGCREQHFPGTRIDTAIGKTVRQLNLLAGFYSEAESAFHSQLLARTLIPDLVLFPIASSRCDGRCRVVEGVAIANPGFDRGLCRGAGLFRHSQWRKCEASVLA